MDFILTIALPAITAFFVGYFLHGGARWTETQGFGLSIAREILLITRKLEIYEEELKQFRDDLKSVVGETVPLIPLTDSDMLVFSGNTGKIGLLDRRLALVVLKFYQQTRDLISESKKHWDGTEAEWIDKNENKVSENWFLFFHAHIDRVSEMIAYITPRMVAIDAWAGQPYWKKLWSDVCNAFRTKKSDDDNAA